MEFLLVPLRVQARYHDQCSSFVWSNMGRNGIKNNNRHLVNNYCCTIL